MHYAHLSAYQNESVTHSIIIDACVDPGGREDFVDVDGTEKRGPQFVKRLQVQVARRQS